MSAPSLHTALSAAIAATGRKGSGSFSAPIEEAVSSMMCDSTSLFFALVLISPACKVVETSNVSRAATDGYHVFLNPAFFAALTIPERKFVIAHEVCHIILQHIPEAAAWVRFGAGPDGRPFDHDIGNRAADYVINDMLGTAGAGVMPKEALWDRAIGTDGEEIKTVYLRLCQQRDEDQMQCSSDDDEGGESGDTGDESDATGDGSPQPGDEQGDGQGEGEGNAKEPARPSWEPGKRGERGSGFDEHDLQAALEDAAKQDAGEESDRPTAEDVLRAVLNAAESAKAQGNMPCNFSRLVDKIIKPPHDWEELLRDEMIQAIGYSEQTYRRLSRPFISRRHPVIMPTYTGYATGTVVLIGDTSGSISDTEMGKALGVIAAILEDAKPEKIVVLWVDAAVAGVQEFTPDEADDIGKLARPEGGGGTDMREGFRWVEDHLLVNGEEVSAVVIVTDGYTPWPAQHPGEGVHSVICVSTTNEKGPEWMTNIHADLA